MGVTGKGLRADGLHKSYMNGSQADNNGSTEKMRTGGGVTDNQMKATGMHKRGLTGNVAEEHSPTGPGAWGHKLQSKDA